MSKADEYRLQARKCIDQAKIVPNIGMKQRMTWLADEWLKMAFQAAMEESPGNLKEITSLSPHVSERN